jgi:DNA (cytosine-5)-methyltransferase 1
MVKRRMGGPYSIEVCAGAGGQALGLEQAGFDHLDLVEIDQWACKTLRENRPAWNVLEIDLKDFKASKYKGIDLYAGGLPCPPFSVAGKQLGDKDERNLFPVALEQISQCRPKAVMIENVRGLLDPSFAAYREWIEASLKKQKFARVEWKLLNACDFAVPQQRTRLILVALREEHAERFRWPVPVRTNNTVGMALGDLMAANGWSGASAWQENARGIAPTIVGGSKKHGGPDLGPTRARQAWAQMGVDGLTIAETAPGPGFPIDQMPKLTVRMVARIQGFPDDWKFVGRKTHAYRQVGNAFPPPVAEAVGKNVRYALGIRGEMLAA